MSSVFASPVRYLVSAVLIAGLALLGGCDNPACVFGPGNCQPGSGGGGGGVGSSSDVGTPSNGSRLDAGPPVLLDAFPSTTAAASPESPIVLTFSESMNPDTLSGAFQILNEFTTLPVPFLDPPPVVADGRVVILQPIGGLPVEQTFVLVVTEDAAVTDISGQAWTASADGTLLNFSVTSQFPEAPQVLATFPADGDNDASDLGEITVIFDRPMVAGDFGTDSFLVRVNGVAASLDPTPLPAIGGTPPAQLPVTQVWTWANEIPGGERDALPLGATVNVTLSPDGALLFANDDAGLDLAETLIEFTLAQFSAPVSVTKPFAPIDAIGGPDLSGAMPLLQAELASPALAGDVLNLFLFGNDPSGSGARSTIARTVSIAEGVQLVDVLPTQLGLLDTAGNPFLGEGEITIAASVTRAGTASAVRLADADPNLPGVQNLVLDTTPPTLVGFGPTGASLGSFSSDQRDLVVVGLANEQVAAATVSSSVGDNFMGGEVPPVAFMGEGGLFVAAPVPVGQFDPAAPNPTFTLRLYDRAFNVTDAIVGSMAPVGGMGPGPALPGPEITVQVFSSLGLTPVVGARVMVHDRDSLATVTELGGPGFTDATGRVTMAASAAGDTLVTVDALGFDLFTFDAVPSSQLTVVLQPTGLLAATSSGEVLGTLPQANISGLSASLRDTRAGLMDTRFELSAPCLPDFPAQVVRCPFGPLVVRPSRIGTRSMAIVNEPILLTSWTAEDYLLAFRLGEGLLPAAPGEAEVDQLLAVDFFLDALGEQDQAVALPSQVFSTAAATGFGAPDGGPVVSIEALAPGIPGPLLIGLGADYPDPVMADTWAVLSAIPGAADGDDDGGTDELGSLVTNGTIQADPFLRGEIRDVDGNVLVARPRLSNSMGGMIVSGVPSLLSPLDGGTTGGTGGAGFNVGALDVIPDVTGLDGLVNVTITDDQGRSWHLWTRDPADSAGLVRIFAPDIGTATLGGTKLSLGPASARVAVYSWASLDEGAFLWSDIEREHELAAFTAPISFTLD